MSIKLPFSPQPWSDWRSGLLLDTCAERFIEAAKKAEADETEEGAEQALKKVAVKKQAKPKCK